jgi:hypothetical protein
MGNPQNKSATGTAQTSTNTSGTLGSNAQSINSVVTPELKQMATNPTGIAPTDVNAMKVGAAQTAGAATAAGNEAATLRAERSGNTAGTATAEDANARNRAKILADTNLSITGKNADVKQNQQQNALKELSQLYGTNVSGSNAATGNALSAEKMEETSPTWLTDLQTGMGTAEQGALTGAKIASM